MSCGNLERRNSSAYVRSEKSSQRRLLRWSSNDEWDLGRRRGDGAERRGRGSLPWGAVWSPAREPDGPGFHESVMYV